LTPLNGPNNSSFDGENNEPVVAGTAVFAGGTLNGYTLVNSGTVSWNNSGDILVTNGGSVNNAAGASFCSPGNTSNLKIVGGALNGSGTINANVSNAGQVNVGGSGSTGVLTINGYYAQTSTGSLGIDLAGLSAGTQYDQLVVSGTVSLAGSLNVGVL